jgi:hypothetical protein
LQSGVDLDEEPLSFVVDSDEFGVAVAANELPLLEGGFFDDWHSAGWAESEVVLVEAYEFRGDLFAWFHLGVGELGHHAHGESVCVTDGPVV